jgi:tetracycline resistance efflux pump
MGWLTILPQVVAIAVVLWRKEVILALLAAIFTSEFLLLIDASGAIALAPLETIERIVGVFSSADSTRILMFSLIIGALIAYLRHSGGVTAMVDLLINKGITKTKKQAGLMSFLIGIVLFVESNLSVITAGIVSRGLFDKFGMSRERLAYVIDSTSAPVCILILINGWGAVVLANLNANGLENAETTLIGTIFFNFYAWIALAIVLYTILSDKLHGPMKECEARKQKETAQDPAPEFPASKASFMLVPLLSLIGLIFVFMIYTSPTGEIRSGDGSQSILYATILSCFVAYIMMLSSGRFTHIRLVEIGFQGMNELLQLVTIVLLSLALGASLKVLGTGAFVAGIAGENLPLIMIVPMLFLASSIMAFTTGTSWGTFALMIPIGVPLIQMLGLPPAFVISAILGGGVFGDHCSPISDTTMISSVASGCSLLDHVRTQLPYALTGGVLTFVVYIIAGIFVI